MEEVVIYDEAHGYYKTQIKQNQGEKAKENLDTIKGGLASRLLLLLEHDDGVSYPSLREAMYVRHSLPYDLICQELPKILFTLAVAGLVEIERGYIFKSNRVRRGDHLPTKVLTALREYEETYDELPLDEVEEWKIQSDY